MQLVRRLSSFTLIMALFALSVSWVVCKEQRPYQKDMISQQRLIARF